MFSIWSNYEWGRMNNGASLGAQRQWICLQCRRPEFYPLSQEDLLQKGMATHSRILAWEIPWTEEPGGLQSMGPQSWTEEAEHQQVAAGWMKLLTPKMHKSKFLEPDNVTLCGKDFEGVIKWNILRWKIILDYLVASYMQSQVSL